jgi:regulator of protease activity HflC (stomatin/prohibitin superfamily)
MEIYYYYAVAAVLIGLVIAMGLFRSVTVYEYEGALMYRKGRFVEVLGAGRHRYWAANTEIVKYDLRPVYIKAIGQEVLTADSISVKATVVARYEIADPVKALTEVQSYYEGIYTELQLALREIIGSATIENVLGERSAIGERLKEMAAGRAEEFGLNLISADVMDVMFPGALKQTMAQVAVARQEGLAALEKARGESAAIRSLVNAGKMLENSPGLMQLKLLQTLAESSDNTLILNLAGEGVPMNILPKGNKTAN